MSLFLYSFSILSRDNEKFTQNQQTNKHTQSESDIWIEQVYLQAYQ